MNRKEKELKEFFKEELNEHLGIKDYDISNFKLESYIENSPKKNNSRILIPVFSLGAIILIIVWIISLKLFVKKIYYSLLKTLSTIPKSTASCPISQ